jgi:hypothetical protein
MEGKANVGNGNTCFNAEAILCFKLIMSTMPSSDVTLSRSSTADSLRENTLPWYSMIP